MRALQFYPAYLCLDHWLWPLKNTTTSLSTEEVGSVHFPISCSKGVELSFNRAVLCCISFQYEQARQAFSEISTQDPTCAMAQWASPCRIYTVLG